MSRLCSIRDLFPDFISACQKYNVSRLDFVPPAFVHAHQSVLLVRPQGGIIDEEEDKITAELAFRTRRLARKSWSLLAAQALRER